MLECVCHGSGGQREEQLQQILEAPASLPCNPYSRRNMKPDCSCIQYAAPLAGSLLLGCTLLVLVSHKHFRV